MLYFVFAVFIFVVRGIILDTTIRNLAYSISSQQTDSSLEATLKHTEKKLWIARIETLLFLAFSAYCLAVVATRPLKKSVDRQQRFIAQISHELRTPLTVMKTGQEVILRSKDSLTQEEAVETLENNLVQINEMSQVIQFLLNFSNLENCTKGITMSKISLATVIQKTITLLQKTADQASVTLEFSDQTEWIKGSEIALREVLINLIKNAINFTPPLGKVCIHLTHNSHNQVLLSVSDTGNGIPPQDLPHIFKPYFRGSLSVEKDNGGLGLGLSIVKQIIKLHHASIAAQSTVGKGTVFTMTFGRL